MTKVHEFKNNFSQLIIETISKEENITFVENRSYFVNPKTLRPGDVFKLNTEILGVNNKRINIHLLIIIETSFPFTFPRVYLSKSSYSKLDILPHVDTNGFICVFEDDIQLPNENDPIGVLRVTISRAKHILEQGLNKLNEADFKEEIESYWDQTYGSEKEPSYLYSLIKSGHPIGEINYARITKNNIIKEYEYILLDESIEAKTFVKNLTQSGAEFEMKKCFYGGELTIEKPPFEITNGKLIEILETNSNLDQFKSFINADKSIGVVIFQLYGRYVGVKVINIISNRFGFRNKNYSKYLSLKRELKNRITNRIKLIPINTDRLIKRTTGLISNTRKMNISLIGLGSVGSNLFHFISSNHSNKLSLCDPDILKVENIKRHLLSTRFINKNKADSLKQLYLEKDPTNSIEAFNTSVFEFLPNNTKDDAYIICVGNSNVEKWILNTLAKSDENKKIIILWVEPYLFGGHMIITNKNFEPDVLLDENIYVNNVIDPEEYKSKNPAISLKEAGCQSSYTPYSGEDVSLFCSSMYSVIKRHLNNPPEDSYKSYTWVGDLKKAESIGIKIKNKFAGLDYGCLQEN